MGTARGTPGPASGHDGLLDQLEEQREPPVHVGAQVQAKDAAAPRGERPEVAQGLGLGERGEAEGTVGDWQDLAVISGQLEEEARGGPPFMELAGRVEEAGAVAGRRGDLERVAEVGADR